MTSSTVVAGPPAEAVFDAVYRRSLSDPEGFWREAAAAIDWVVPPGDQILDASASPFYRWFPGAQLNTCYNALDRHADGPRADQTALIYDSPVTDTKRTYTYRELRDEVARFAGVLYSLDVRKGDRVVIYMPMIPEAIVAMLACARLGAVHSVVFGGFAPHELAVRIDHARPKVVLSASCGIEGARVIAYKPMLDQALAETGFPPDKCVIFQRPQVEATLVEGRDIDWSDAMSGAEPEGCTTVAATDPLYILYTSGTTGVPKGVVRDNGGHAVALAWTMPNIYGVEPGETFWAASDVGWVVGHSYIVYAPLLAGATTVLYEGKPVGTPDPGAYWRVISEHGVKVMFTAPTGFRAIKKEDPKGEFLRRYDITCLRTLFLAGERLDPDTYEWASGLLGIPVVDHWWQTETGWPIAANCMGIEPLPIKPGSPTKAVPGYDVRILDTEGSEMPSGKEGAVAIRLPLPPGTLPTLYLDDDRFVRSYLTRYPGHYLTGDGGYVDEDGYLFIMGRVDDIINVAGHRLSTGAMEEAIAQHPDIAECAVIGIGDEMKGQVPIGLVVLKAGVERDPTEIEEEVVALVRNHVGPVASFKKATVVSRLPKTRSGKILRATMREIADDRPVNVPSTIDDPAILDEIRVSLNKTSL
jgi:propionyl-CoA synthetase